MEDLKDILHQINELKGQIDKVIHGQIQIKQEIRALFCDVTQFENMVLKIMDNAASNSLSWRDKDTEEEYKH